MADSEKQKKRKPIYTTHPTVVAAASILGATTSIGFFLAIGLVLFGSRMDSDQTFYLVIGAFGLGYLFWWIMRTEITNEIENSD